MIVDPSALIDLARYPIADLSSPAARALVASAQRQLGESGLCLLPGLVRPAAVEAIVPEAEAALPSAFLKQRSIGAYPGDDPVHERFPEGHPLRRPRRNVMRVIACDLFPADSKLRALYEWDALATFLSAVLGEPVYRCADPLVALVVTVIGDGEQHPWHFDENDFVVSLLLQAPERGGEFEFAPMIRSSEDEDYAGVERVLAGASDRVVSVALEPGTLALFRGRRSIHRVAPVSGSRERMVALLSYDSEPGMVFSAEVQRNNTGRVLAPAAP